MTNNVTAIDWLMTFAEVEKYMDMPEGQFAEGLAEHDPLHPNPTLVTMPDGELRIYKHVLDEWIDSTPPIEAYWELEASKRGITVEDVVAEIRADLAEGRPRRNC
jgi:hypothetical protein